MKYLIFFALLFCSQLVFAQQQNNDLIVTKTGDSIFCKIIDVNSSEIQFRFDHRGRIITIKREQTVSYTYNYIPLTEQDQSTVTEQGQSTVIEQSQSMVIEQSQSMGEQGQSAVTRLPGGRGAGGRRRPSAPIFRHRPLR